MNPKIDKKQTGLQIRHWMDLRGIGVEDVRAYLQLNSVQAVYHWLAGRCLPSLENLYALSKLLQVPMDQLVASEKETHIYSHMVSLEYSKGQPRMSLCLLRA